MRRERGCLHKMMGLGLSQCFIRCCRPPCLPPNSSCPPGGLVRRGPRGGHLRVIPAANFEFRMYLSTAQLRCRALSFSPLEERKASVKRLGTSGSTPDGRLILLDGKALVYRAYYRISAKILHNSLRKMSKEDSPENSSWDSVMTTVITLSEVLNVLEHQPSHVAAVFDFPGATFRHSMYLGYKSHRLVTPDTVQQAVRNTKHTLLGMGVRIIEVPGVEADDVIGTLAMKAVEKKMKVRVVSLDRDFFQILSPQLRLLRFRQGAPGYDSFGVEEFRKRYPGLEVSQFIDMRALVGDIADNVPGISGIGEMTALKLIQEFGTLENLLENRDKINNARARARLLDDSGDAPLSKKLLKLKLDVPEFAIGCSLEDLRCKKPEDGGKGYARLVEAYGAIVGSDVGVDILNRTFGYWDNLYLANTREADF